jgi:hypothetical protein
MLRANERVRNALREIRTAEVEVSYHCRRCKGYYTGSVAVRGLSRAACHCGSDDLLILSVAPDPSSPLFPGAARLAAAHHRGRERS